MRHLVCLSRSRSITECTGKTYKLFNMPEGHVIHRLAHTFNQDFRGMDLEVSSPQGRFAAEAKQLDGWRLERAEAWGKHLFLLFDAPSPTHIIYVHLGLIGQFYLKTRIPCVGRLG